MLNFDILVRDFSYPTLCIPRDHILTAGKKCSGTAALTPSGESPRIVVSKKGGVKAVEGICMKKAVHDKGKPGVPGRADVIATAGNKKQCTAGGEE